MWRHLCPRECASHLGRSRQISRQISADLDRRVAHRIGGASRRISAHLGPRGGAHLGESLGQLRLLHQRPPEHRRRALVGERVSDRAQPLGDGPVQLEPTQSH